MPKPKPGETEADWMKRCVPVAIEEGRPQKQAVAMCLTQFRTRATDATDRRYYTLVGASSGPLRAARFEGRQHLVVPVVALVGDVVLQALGSAGPELIPAAVVERSVGGWNGEPVVADHPLASDGALLSANDPEVYERAAFGRIAHPRFEDGKLLVEAWIDPAKAERVGASDVLAKLEAGETIEVSIGAGVQTVARLGTLGGKPYEAMWTSILPDHLALGLAGGIGACSVEMGCGAPRAARYRVTDRGVEPQEDAMAGVEPDRTSFHQDDAVALAAEPPVRPSGPIAARLRAAAAALGEFFLDPPGTRAETLLARAGAGESDMDVRRVLDAELRAGVPAYVGIDSVFPDEGLVVYAVEEAEGAVRLFRRKYDLGDGGKTKFKGEPEEVKAVMKYEPIGARSNDTPGEPRAACACQGHLTTSGATEEVRMAENSAKERVKALIESASDEQIAEWEATLAAASDPKPKPEPVAVPVLVSSPEPAVVAAAARANNQISDEELARMRAALRREEQREADRKADLVASLRSAQSRFDEARLGTMTIEQLEDVAALVGVTAPAPVDYSLARGARPSTSTPDSIEPPDTWGIAKKLASQRGVN